MKTTKVLLVLSITLLSVCSLHAQTTPAPANEVLLQAKAEAAKTHKNVFVIFHASWCIWCHRMDTAMNDKSIKPFFDKNFVITHLTLDESKDHKNLENPGAEEIRTRYHGDQQGIPFWFIIDKDGNLLADSRLRSEKDSSVGNNVGCPAQPDEVDYFIRVLRSTTSLTAPQLALIKTRFSKIAPQSN